jgi:phospholipid/cholesterol/gamma-HCH transport system substrate-binding protein
MSLFTQTAKDRRLAVRVGGFVALALVMAGLVVFMIGKKTHLFEKKVVYRTYFDSAEGVSAHSPVWLGGLAVGSVDRVGFSSNPGEKRMEIWVSLSAEYASRVRTDSVASLSSLGVLGDKAVEISIGSVDRPVVADGGDLPSESSGDVASMMKGAAKVMDDAMAVSGVLRKAVDVYADPRLAHDISAGVSSLRGVLEEVEKGDGVLHALIYDKDAGRQARELMSNATRTAARMDQALARVDTLLGQVEHGQGTAHSLLYGTEGTRALAELGGAAGQLASLLEDAKKNPDGVVHQLVYGSAGGMLSDLGSAAADLKSITAGVARGEGSVGGLLKDPTVYEDLREVVGNVKRNRVLRALVRLSIDNNKNIQYVGRPLVPARDEANQTGIGGAGAVSTPPPFVLPPPPIPPHSGK